MTTNRNEWPRATWLKPSTARDGQITHPRNQRNKEEKAIRDTEYDASVAPYPKAGRIFEWKHVWRILVDWTGSVGCSDWFVACSAGTRCAGIFKSALPRWHVLYLKTVQHVSNTLTRSETLKNISWDRGVTRANTNFLWLYAILPRPTFHVGFLFLSLFSASWSESGRYRTVACADIL